MCVYYNANLKESVTKAPSGGANSSVDVADAVKEKPQKEHESLDPLLLLKKIATLKKKIYELAKASRNRRATE